jgi:hypothetical protein
LNADDKVKPFVSRNWLIIRILWQRGENPNAKERH